MSQSIVITKNKIVIADISRSSYMYKAICDTCNVPNGEYKEFTPSQLSNSLNWIAQEIIITKEDIERLKQPLQYYKNSEEIDAQMESIYELQDKIEQLNFAQAYLTAVIDACELYTYDENEKVVPTTLEWGIM